MVSFASAAPLYDFGPIDIIRQSKVSLSVRTVLAVIPTDLRTSCRAKIETCHSSARVGGGNKSISVVEKFWVPITGWLPTASAGPCGLINGYLTHLQPDASRALPIVSINLVDSGAGNTSNEKSNGSFSLMANIILALDSKFITRGASRASSSTRAKFASAACCSANLASALAVSTWDSRAASMSRSYGLDAHSAANSTATPNATNAAATNFATAIGFGARQR
jgi:hypothetical protein